MKPKQYFCALLSAVLLAGVCTACSPASDTLVIAAPQGQIARLRQAAKKAGGQTNVEFVELPGFSSTEGDEASQQLEQLRTEWMAGEGPDLLLLNESPQIFPDLTKSALGGVFCDLAPLLDSELAGMNLVGPVLDAGVWDGKRYILPLGFRVDGIQIEQEVWDEVSRLETPAAFLGELSQLSQPPAQLFYFDMQYSRSAPLLDHTSQTLQLEQLRELYALVSEWQAAGLAQAELDAGASFQADILDGTEQMTAREDARFAAIPNGAGGCTAYPVLMGVVRANSPHAQQAADILLALFTHTETDSEGNISADFGFPMLPVERGALEQVTAATPELAELARQVNRAILPCPRENGLFARMMAAAAAGEDFDDAAAAIRQEYRYYFEE